MDIKYKTKKLKKVCTNAQEAAKAYGYEMAEKIHLRIDQIAVAESIEQMIQFKIGRCHSLTGNREGQFAMDLKHPYRLIFKKVESETTIVRIEEIKDYH